MACLKGTPFYSTVSFNQPRPRLNGQEEFNLAFFMCLPVQDRTEKSVNNNFVVKGLNPGVISKG